MAVSFWKKDVENTIEIDLGIKDIYGADGFALYTKFQDEDTPTKQDVDFNELVEDISDPVSCKTQGDTEAGAREIKVDDTSKLEVGMRLDDGNGQVFYISKVLDDSIVIRRPLKKDIADGTDLNQVGNMGIYEAKFTPDKTGALTFLISNPSIGLQNESAKVQVVNNLTDDVSSEIAQTKDDLGNKIDTILENIGASEDVVVGKILA